MLGEPSHLKLLSSKSVVPTSRGLLLVHLRGILKIRSPKQEEPSSIQHGGRLWEDLQRVLNFCGDECLGSHAQRVIDLPPNRLALLAAIPSKLPKSRNPSIPSLNPKP